MGGLACFNGSIFRWIVKMQSKLVRCESQIKMRKEYLKRVAEKVKMLEQVLTSAEYACKIVTEICRRKQFSSEFLEVDFKC